MAEKFDRVVLGAGPGGYVAAIRAAQHAGDYRVTIPGPITFDWTIPRWRRSARPRSRRARRGWTSRWGASRSRATARRSRAGHTDGFIKVIANKARGEIVGVHCTGDGVTDLIAEMSLAMSSEATAAPWAKRCTSEVRGGRPRTKLNSCRRQPAP